LDISQKAIERLKPVQTAINTFKTWEEETQKKIDQVHDPATYPREIKSAWKKAQDACLACVADTPHVALMKYIIQRSPRARVVILISEHSIKHKDSELGKNVIAVLKREKNEPRKVPSEIVKQMCELLPREETEEAAREIITTNWIHMRHWVAHLKEQVIAIHRLYLQQGLPLDLTGLSAS
jgi:hypothetical protein